ncbi:hypothetical protein EVG20_g4921 [Dentipellis fragilis]|uniref:Homeobox domain-containing protein n=1 Tax=Dentipellis fragilis TaxID=205917 RepID=A0A4Y9YYG3_9AGAM|nr:hypothetical protein EVG20_g4921 [Dentipellis fragilis]
MDSDFPIRSILSTHDKDELTQIWDTDKRTPSVPSRRAWAKARNLNPGTVHSWFQRAKNKLRRSGALVVDGHYELPIGFPSTPRRQYILGDVAEEDNRLWKRVKTEHVAPSIPLYPSDASTIVGSADFPEGIVDVPKLTSWAETSDFYKSWPHSDSTSLPSSDTLPSTPTPSPVTHRKRAYTRHPPFETMSSSGLVPLSSGFAYNALAGSGSRSSVNPSALKPCYGSYEDRFSDLFASSPLPPSSPYLPTFALSDNDSASSCSSSVHEDDDQDATDRSLPGGNATHEVSKPFFCDCKWCADPTEAELAEMEILARKALTWSSAGQDFLVAEYNMIQPVTRLETVIPTFDPLRQATEDEEKAIDFEEELEAWLAEGPAEDEVEAIQKSCVDAGLTSLPDEEARVLSAWKDEQRPGMPAIVKEEDSD